ncbi:hypothetical protein QOT17_017895 [Balamuthia mandrillaris]
MFFSPAPFTSSATNLQPLGYSAYPLRPTSQSFHRCSISSNHRCASSKCRSAASNHRCDSSTRWYAASNRRCAASNRWSAASNHRSAASNRSRAASIQLRKIFSSLPVAGRFPSDANLSPAVLLKR